MYIRCGYISFLIQKFFLFSWPNYVSFSYGFLSDQVSVSFVLLTTFLIAVCVFISILTIHVKIRGFLLMLFLIEFLLIYSFTVSTLFQFYVVFESILIPMFFLIGLWGSRRRKVIAAYYIFLYTVAGSILFLLALIYIKFI